MREDVVQHGQPMYSVRALGSEPEKLPVLMSIVDSQDAVKESWTNVGRYLTSDDHNKLFGAEAVTSSDRFAYFPKSKILVVDSPDKIANHDGVA